MKFIKELISATGYATLWKVRNNYYLVSSVSNALVDETLVFEGDRDGLVKYWVEVYGCEYTTDHARVMQDFLKTRGDD